MYIYSSYGVVHRPECNKVMSCVVNHLLISLLPRYNAVMCLVNSPAFVIAIPCCLLVIQRQINVFK